MSRAADGALRVVLYAEGGGETAGSSIGRPAPTHRLSEAQLGPAHLLFRRALVSTRSLQPSAVVFEEGQRAVIGRRPRVPRGSDLLKRSVLRTILTWPTPTGQPDLAVVLVDRDEDSKRASKLRRYCGALLCPVVVAVAVEEFEAWLVADDASVGRVLQTEFRTLAKPETLSPGEAKRSLRAAIARGEIDAMEARRRIALACDLAIVAKRCRSFTRLLKDLGAEP